MNLDVVGKTKVAGMDVEIIDPVEVNTVRPKPMLLLSLLIYILFSVRKKIGEA